MHQALRDILGNLIGLGRCAVLGDGQNADDALVGGQDSDTDVLVGGSSSSGTAVDNVVQDAAGETGDSSAVHGDAGQVSGGVGLDDLAGRVDHDFSQTNVLAGLLGQLDLQANGVNGLVEGEGRMRTVVIALTNLLFIADNGVFGTIQGILELHCTGHSNVVIGVVVQIHAVDQMCSVPGHGDGCMIPISMVIPVGPTGVGVMIGLVHTVNDGLQVV